MVSRRLVVLGTLLMGAEGCDRPDLPCIPVAWFLDHDGDGYAGTEFEVACEAPPEGRDIKGGGDCDDDDPSVYPDLFKHDVCDDAGVDENCNGLVDDEDNNVDGQQYWYRDADGDGYSGAEGEVYACDPPEGYSDGWDCDDTDPNIYQGADEVCGDGVDSDCGASTASS